jgi:L-lactate dehydrogenase (cytochrome)/(S)-mandelate dehydrogenase
VAIGSSDVERARNIADLRAIARRRVARAFFEFMDRGTEDETQLRRNREALDAVHLRPDILRDVREIDTSTKLLGRTLPLPLAIAPTGVANMIAFNGELALAKTAAAAGIPFTLATSSTTTIEEVGRAASAGFWLQLYVWEDREATWAVVERARAAEAEALVITVDAPVLANREYNDRNGFSFPVKPSPVLVADMLAHPQWLIGVIGRYWLSGGTPRFVNYPQSIGGKVTRGTGRRANAASITWDDIARFRDRWDRKLILKGVLTPEATLRAAETGVDAVIVSNHGGRMFDPGPAAIDALGPVARAAPDGLTVLFDSGIRRGADIVRALALGADAVLVGRSTLYGVAAGGRAGAERAVAILESELRRTMALCGICSIAEIGPDCLWPSGSQRLPVDDRYVDQVG